MGRGKKHTAEQIVNLLRRVVSECCEQEDVTASLQGG